MKYKAEWYKSPVNLPESKSGKISIQKKILPPGDKVAIVGMRQAFLRGQKPISGVIKEPLTIHSLVHEDRGIWMTDLPEELNQIGELLHNINPHGKIMVGGLGLGILAKTLADRTGVESVTVVEIDPDVVKLCAQPGYTVVTADVMEYLRTTNDQFDFYLLDTWQGTNEGTWWSQVMPQRRIIRNRFGSKPIIHCWAEDIMQGQVLLNLVHGVPHWYYSHLPIPMSDNAARSFLRNVGNKEVGERLWDSH
jgi:hypothetical protein